MKVSSLVYNTEQGLGYLAKDFYDSGLVTHPFILEHAHWSQRKDWYPSDTPSLPVQRINRRYDIIMDHLSQCDCVLFFETPFEHRLIRDLREKKVKTALMVMYECCTPELPYQPDVVLSPSHLDKEYYPDSVYLPVPLPKTLVHRQRKRAITFIHNAGRLGLKYRNGTGEVLDCVQYLESDAHVVINTQKKLPWSIPQIPNLTVNVGSMPNRNSLYELGDIFLFPEKFNGLSLPIQEAFASGMPVMCGNRNPFNQWLPNDTLVPVESYEKDKVAARFNEFDSAVINPRAIAECIDYWYGKDISVLSDIGRFYYERYVWSDKWVELYRKVLRGESVVFADNIVELYNSQLKEDRDENPVCS